MCARGSKERGREGQLWSVFFFFVASCLSGSVNLSFRGKMTLGDQKHTGGLL